VENESGKEITLLKFDSARHLVQMKKFQFEEFSTATGAF